MTAVNEETEARAEHKQQIERAEESLRQLLEGRPEARIRGEKTVEATLYNLKGERVRTARRSIEDLLEVERIRTGPDDPIRYGPKIVATAEEVKKTLQPELAEGTERNKKRLLPVFEVLDAIIESLSEADEEISAARQREKETKAERWPSEKKRATVTERWGNVLGWSLDLLENFGEPVPDWAEVTPSVLASALADLADKQPQLNLRDDVVAPLDNGDVISAWLALYDLTERFRNGELKLESR